MMSVNHVKSFPERPVLIVDDEANWVRSLSLLLERSLEINHIRTCQDSREVLTIVEQQQPSLVLLDVTMPYLTCEQQSVKIKETCPELPVIMVSGRNQLEIAVHCMKHGAFDYFVKSSDDQRLLTSIRHALELNSLRDENAQLRESLRSQELKHPEAFAELISDSSSMQSVFRYIEAVAASSEPVLICGESGTGKELVAKAVHHLSTHGGGWVAVNAAGLDDHVFSDTLFGHVRGAFTDAREARAGMVEQAQNGTLFLDEIGDLNQASQVKLLRLIQEREYLPLGSDRPKKTNARFVFATNQELQCRVDQGRFRKDLFHRLNTHRVVLPPLRERPEDIGPLLQYFLSEAAAAMNRPVPATPPQLLTVLRNYRFPGNVRELRAMVYDALSQHHRGTLSCGRFQEHIDRAQEQQQELRFSATVSQTSTRLQFPDVLPTLKEVADLLVDEALQRTDYNQTQAARLLGVTRPALSKRLANRKPHSD